MIPQYRRLLQSANEVIELSKKNQDNDLLSSQLAAHACILLSGAVESAIRELIPEFAAKKSHPAVANYVKETLRTFTNANPEKLVALLKQFDGKWSEKLEAMWADGVKDHVGSVVGNRHLIAHGKNTTLTPNRVDEWRRSIVKLCNHLEGEMLAP
jgi:uncharacterized protein YjbJ (UPF0337 family)